MGPRKGPRPEVNPRPIFQGLVIAVTGFKGGKWNETNMSRWISLRKGRLSSQMDASVTHLVCSEEDVKQKHPKVREAQKRGIKNCKLVTLDWLEDSMHAKRVLPEGDFSPQKALLKAKKIEARKKQVEKGFEQAVKTVNTNLYHHYQDHTYFTYVVTLRRDHVTPGERYVLFLEESNNSKPHLYWFFAKYYKNKGNTYAHVYRPSFTSGLFQREFDHFKHFFKTKTGIDWDDRLIKEGMAPADKKFFHYTSPTGGKPVGWVPPGNEKPDPPPPLPNPSFLNLDDLDLQQPSSIPEDAAASDSQQQHEEEDQQPPTIEMLENHDQLHNTMETEAEEMEAAEGGGRR
ncbi:hypothetical protein QBC37DRAFT_84564 [Rhypophila decipiens]|uniref:BRCT domain-containing protein n=1 Tax=Rhypophila decipiens TaxID=261697 RepID=A0AAN7BAD2_9PEZI|nr:hypothetical protein QBC37DRAFT_84564 [Rhypophila decipiens]